MAPEQDRPASLAPVWLVRSAAVGGRLLVLGVLVWLLAELATMLTTVLVAVLVALLLAGVFAPAVRWAAGKGLPPWLAPGLSVLLLLLLVAGAGAGIGVRLAAELPELQDQVQTAASDLSETLGVDIPFGSGSDSEGGSSEEGGSEEGSSEEGSSESGSSEEGSSSGFQTFSNLASSLSVVGEVLIGAFLVLVLMFLFLKDGGDLWRWMLDKLGGRLRDDVDAAGRAAWRTSGAYVRELSIVAAFDAVGIAIGLLLLGVPLALTLAALQFIASYIPTIGAFVAGIVAAAVAYAAGGLGLAAATLAVVIGVQQVGTNIIQPYVMSRGLPLHASVVLIAVVAGGLLWGIPGALLFVPLAAAVTAASHELWERHGRPPIAGGPRDVEQQDQPT